MLGHLVWVFIFSRKLWIISTKFYSFCIRFYRNRMIGSVWISKLKAWINFFLNVFVICYTVRFLLVYYLLLLNHNAPWSWSKCPSFWDWLHMYFFAISFRRSLHMTKWWSDAASDIHAVLRIHLWAKTDPPMTKLLPAQKAVKRSPLLFIALLKFKKSIKNTICNIFPIEKKASFPWIYVLPYTIFQKLKTFKTVEMSEKMLFFRLKKNLQIAILEDF